MYKPEINALESAYKGTRINGVALPGGGDVASVRSGRSSIDNLMWMLPENREKLGRDLANWNAMTIDLNDVAERAKMRSRISRSLTDAVVGRELAAYREFILLKDVLALPFALAGFQAINLSNDELPLIRRPQPQQFFGVNYISSEGMPRHEQWRTTAQADQMLMGMVSSRKIEYPIQDIQFGSIEEFSRVNDTIRYDLEINIDQLAQTQIDNNETDSGLRDLLNLHPFIVANNVPDANHLDLTDVSYGTAHVLTINRIKAILNHFALFGGGVQGFDADGPMSLASMVISPQNVRDQWDYVDLVSFDISGDAYHAKPTNTVLPSVRDQVYKTGMMNSAWGQNWTTQQNARLDVGRLYAFSNQPCGWFFTKTGMDQFIKWEGPDQQNNNYGAALMRRVIQFVTPDLWKHRILTVDF